MAFFRNLVFGGTVALAAQGAGAALLEVDLFAPGDAMLTRDTATGLDWLDLTATTGLSANAVAGGAGGWTSLGFRFASPAEWYTLATGGFGATVFAGGWGYNGQWSQGVMAVAMLGNTCPSCVGGSHPGQGYSSGWLYGPDGDGTPYAIGAYGAGYVFGTNPDGIFYNTPSYWDGTLAYTTYGNFLVRASDWTAVPEPAPLALLGLGLGLLFLRKKGLSKYI